jgi:hypothetical protein
MPPDVASDYSRETGRGYELSGFATLIQHLGNEPLRISLLGTGVKIPAERSGCYRVEGDFVAQPFQTPHKTTLDELTIPLIEVIAT